MENTIMDESVLIIEKVTDFPSLNNLIKSFLRSKSITKSYRVEKKTKNLVKVFLRHSDVTFELMKFLNTEQITNPKLKGIKCSMQILQERQSSFPINHNIKNKSSDEENEEEIEESVTKKEKKEEKSSSKNKEKYKLIYKKYNEYEPIGVIQMNSPYITEKERNDIIEKEKKELLINKPRFYSYFDNATNNTHPTENYIDDPPKFSPSEFKFRDDDKDKWITKEDFLV